jgi:4-hydroxybenzoate polyprenyltransferase
VYLINDVIDCKQDSEHPVKKFRPIASGKVNRSLAVGLAVLLFVASLLSAYLVSGQLSVVLGSYIALNFTYTFYFKKVVIADVICIALGFVLRVIAGAVAIQVVFSSWLLLCTFFLALFLAIGKRKNELVHLGAGGRGVLGDYSTELLDQMNAVVLPSVLITYALYTFNSWHSQWLIATVPVVLYGLFRYLYVVNKKKIDNDGPTSDLLSDRPLQLTVLFWSFLVILILFKF